MHLKVKQALLFILVIILVSPHIVISGTVQANTSIEWGFVDESSFDDVFDPNQTWIIKWKHSEDPSFIDTSEIIERLPEFNAVVARPSGLDDRKNWVSVWRNSPHVQYIQTNHKVQIQAIPDDPLFSLQKHLTQIRIESAWDMVRENTNITIAVVDTGIDLTHPDLKDNLVNGRNFIDSSKPPQDDNGHGTNVAGVIGASGNNGTGISGVLWRSKIMPVKALEASGSGDESKLGQGIKYAVDNGAKIIVLSLGLYKFSPFMRDVVQYAENNHVLLVAASGNDGQDVKYPAAYPTVLAVGGVNENKQVVNRSNYGQEIDVVAPWNVYTTMLGGLYGSNEGTSMAAPQVAAVAALIWAQNPDYRPHQIRNKIRQSTEDIGPTGWDPRSGYGMLRADLALSQPYREDLYENNNTRATAKMMPLGSMLSASLSSASDQDWYMINAEYDGQVTLQFISDQSLARMELVYFSAGSNNGTVYSDVRTPITIPIKKGQSYVQVRASSQFTGNQALPYRIIPQFVIYADAFEDNDRQFKAYALPAQIQTITGTFHQLNDEDWFLLNILEAGSMRIRVSTDTYRMDLELLIQRQGDRARIYDFGLDGGTEFSPNIDVFPGKYYVRVRNVISEEAYPVIGEYTMDINYLRKYVDPNEPNDRALQATAMTMNQNYQGVLTVNDVDWFSFKVDQINSYVTINLSNIPIDRMISLSLLNQVQNQLSKNINTLGNRQMVVNRLLNPGTYYVRLTANQPFDYQMYQIKVNAEPLISGYRDIKGHWAQTDIVNLTNKGIVKGYDDYLFKPNHSITRAEVVTMIVKALNLSGQQNNSFIDVNTSHWAHKEISIAAGASIINGYPDGSFRPNQPTNRAEMVAMISNALGLSGNQTGPLPFTDTRATDWYASILRQMKAEGWINGYADGSFRPMNAATRAEFVSFVSRLIQ